MVEQNDLEQQEKGKERKEGRMEGRKAGREGRKARKEGAQESTLSWAGNLLPEPDVPASDQ